MARNRKRAKERRARRPQPVASARTERDEAPAPIVHATPDVEIAEAQLALGRPELTEVEEEPELAGAELAQPEAEEPELEEAEEPDGAELEPEFEEAETEAVAPEVDGGPAARSELAVAGGREAVVARPRPGNRLVNFLQGSWRELQRVQWPDRRQVVQATGVVIGFVIVAGVFLGVADALASKIMNYVLTGHFK